MKLTLGSSCTLQKHSAALPAPLMHVAPPVCPRVSQPAVLLGSHRQFAPFPRNPDVSRNVQTRFKEEQKPEPVASKPSTKPRNLIMCLDGTKESEACVEWAVAHLLRAGDVAHVLHMVPSVPAEHVFTLPAGRLLHVTTAVATAMEDQLRGVYQARAKELCARLGPQLAAAQVGLHVHVMPQPGSTGKSAIGRAICEQAEALEAAAVVVASHSHGGLAEFIRGSVADYAVRNCSRPVAVLHEPARALASATAAPADIQKAHHAHSLHGTWHSSSSSSNGSTGAVAGGRQLVVAVDSTDDSLAACRWILDNMYHPGDVLHLVHVVPCLPSVLPTTGSEFLLDPSVGYTAIYAGFEAAAKQQELARDEATAWQSMQALRYKEIMEKYGAQYTFDILVEYTEDPVGTISDAICSKADELGAAAVVLSYHHHAPILEFIMGSVTSHVTHHCSRPVVVLHGNDPSDDRR